MARGSRRLWLAVVLAASLVAACGGTPRPPARELTVWRNLGAWSGHGLLQTDSFISDTGLLRVTWETRHETTPAAGTLRVSLHSAVSGRPLAVAVEHRGVGRDTTYVTEDPREFYLLIESAGLDWSVEIAEGVPATAGGR